MHAEMLLGGDMRILLNALMAALLIGRIAPSIGWAQATAQISGTVRDTSGAVLPGVQSRRHNPRLAFLDPP